MSITKLDDGRWFVDVEPIKGKRFRKRFKTKGEAQRYEATARQKCIENPAWSIKPKDRCRLSELVHLLYDLHGHSLRDAPRRLSKMLQLTARLSDPVRPPWMRLRMRACGGSGWRRGYPGRP